MTIFVTLCIRVSKYLVTKAVRKPQIMPIAVPPRATSRKEPTPLAMSMGMMFSSPSSLKPSNKWYST